MICITRFFFTLSRSMDWYWVIELPQISQLYSRIEQITAMYILIKSAGGIPYPRNILSICKRLEAFAIID